MKMSKFRFSYKLNQHYSSIRLRNVDLTEISTCNKTPRRLELEKSLFNGLKQRSLTRIFNWFDCHEETTVKADVGIRRWMTESVARDCLFLELLCVAKS